VTAGGREPVVVRVIETSAGSVMSIIGRPSSLTSFKQFSDQRRDTSNTGIPHPSRYGFVGSPGQLTARQVLRASPLILRHLDH
jgi:hypothetical protein